MTDEQDYQFCQKHNLRYAHYITVDERGKSVAIPICAKHYDKCNYKGQQLEGFFICDGKLLQDRKNKPLEARLQ